MTPPKPPPSTHQSASEATPKRHHHKRHTQQQHQPPEEPPSLARKGRASRSAQPPARSHSTAPDSESTPIPAATGVAPEVEHAGDGAGNPAVQPPSSSRHRRPPLPAESSVARTYFPTAGIEIFGDLGVNGRRSRIEEVEGLAGLLPGSANSMASDNGGPPNSGRIWIDGTSQMLDAIPERNPSSILRYEVHTEMGEVWERGPEKVIREGSSVRAIFPSPPHGAPQVLSRAGGVPANSNTANSSRSGAGASHPLASDARVDGIGGDGGFPDRAGRAGGRLATSAPAGMPAGSEVFQQIQESGIVSSGGPGGYSLGMKQANIPNYTSRGDGCEGGRGRTFSERAKLAQNWADCTVRICPDFASFGDATDFASMEGRPRGQVGIEDGNMGFNSSMVRGATGSRYHYNGPPNMATQQQFPAGPDFANFGDATDFASMEGRARGQVGIEAGQMGFNSSLVRGATESRV